MSRNAEKANSILYRFRQAQLQEIGKFQQFNRPRTTDVVTRLPEAEKWRGAVMMEITNKVAKMSDPSLTEHQLRDMNDEINDLFNEKNNWECRIKELGGPDHRNKGFKVMDEDGKEIPMMKGYKYFGRARELPGVKELLRKSAQEKQAEVQEKSEAMNISYYGVLDEEDGVLLNYEEKREKEMYQETKPTEPAKKKAKTGLDSILSVSQDQHIVELLNPEYIPTLKEVEYWLVERKKKELLEKYQ